MRRGAGAQMSYRRRHDRRARRPSVRDLASTTHSGALAALSVLRRIVLTAAAGLVLCSVTPAGFGWTPTVVVSGSMAPAVRTGDLVVASPVTPAEVHHLAMGTVVLVEDPAKGDANAVRDSTPVPAENLRGQARLRIPALGLPAAWVRNGQYAPAAAFAILVAIAVFWRAPRAHDRPDPGTGGHGRHRSHPARHRAAGSTRRRAGFASSQVGWRAADRSNARHGLVVATPMS